MVRGRGRERKVDGIREKKRNNKDRHFEGVQRRLVCGMKGERGEVDFEFENCATMKVC